MIWPLCKLVRCDIACWRVARTIQSRIAPASVVLLAAASAVFGAESGAVDKSYAERIQPFLDKYCVSCHGPEKQKGKFRVDTLPSDFAKSAIQGKWIEVMDRINLAEMPPDDSPRPDAAAVREVASWIAGELRTAGSQALSRDGRVLLRRMNRAEYANTVADLLGIRFLPGDSPLDFLPPDGTAMGFDKVGAALTLDPSLLDKYYEVALRIANVAIVEGPPEFPTLRKRFDFAETARWSPIAYLCDHPQFQCRENDVALMEGGARSYAKLNYGKTNRMIPAKGFYAIRVMASADPGQRGEPLKMKVVRGDEILLETVVEAAPSSPKIYEVILPLDAPGGNEIEVSLVNGTRFTTVQRAGLDMNAAVERAGLKKDFAEVMRLGGRTRLEGAGTGQFVPEVLDRDKLPKLILNWVEVEGPLQDQWPPKSHTAIFFRGEDAKEDAAYAKEIFERILPRAFRRPVTADECASIVKLVEDELALGTSFKDAVRVGLAATLTSPKFLYLWEPAGETTRLLNDYELASRLSYFLWSSMPDEELIRLATAGKLHQPAMLETQVERMLSDPRSRSLVGGFAAQWLRTDEIRRFRPDPKIYRNYNDRLGKAMAAQPLAFFEEVLRKNVSALSFLDSDWTMLNETLAAFYGIDAVKSEEFQRVALPADSPRGGLLGQAGIAMWGSDGTRTKPVSRGVFVREVFFNDPPDPPPPNVGEIEPHIQGKNLTVRERLLQHQKIENCASCHRGIDPYGLALENFNAIGQWRDRQDGEGFQGNKAPVIDVSGRLPNGKDFHDFREYKALLAEQKDRFRKGLTEKMLVYALGRPVQPADRPTIYSAIKKMTGGGDTIRSLIKSIVISPQFTRK
jgi:mono/diheme cytochrome c family protein